MLWWCAGLAIGFGYSNALCTDTKLYIIFSMLMVGIACYFCAEYVNKREQRATAPIAEIAIKEVRPDMNGGEQAVKTIGYNNVVVGDDELPSKPS